MKPCKWRHQCLYHLYILWTLLQYLSWTVAQLGSWLVHELFFSDPPSRLNGKIGLAILGVYRSPNVALSWESDLEEALTRAICESNHMVCLGDFNINAADISHTCWTRLLHISRSLSIRQVIKEPTRSDSILDLIFVSDDLLLLDSGVAKLSREFDHDLIFCDINLDLSTRPSVYRVGRDFKFCPLRRFKIARPRPPWFSNSVKIIARARDRARSKWCTSKTVIDRDKYVLLRNFATSSLRREKSGYLSSLSDRPSSKHMWEKVNLADTIPSAVASETLIRDLQSSASNISPNSQNTFVFKEIGFSHLYHAMKSFTSTATGSDDINSSSVYLCVPSCLPALLNIMNTSLRQAKFPLAWGSVLEKICLQQLTPFIDNNKVLPLNQSGFRKGFSAATTLLHVSDEVGRSLDCAEVTLLALLDLSRAFETLDHRLLLEKLESIGVVTI
ncbi:uncharacterized protein LOC117180729 [Belonocnema kinseyi]|uniref:uncharacterized protein LOC117180729 n=1 Tax=Belonocnema kinseyi TaxID=2817044 RepID=UPI00143DF3E7|nr:uncharacterized protein LOC117180729 [Belonocnema kinseyi]